MKVTKIETLRASRFIYVRVHTDEGISGVGELHPASGTSGTPFAPIAAVDYCAEYLIGKDPLHIERNWQHMFRRCVFRGGADTMAAIGAIDIALWDIKGKAAELPVHSLLGGPTRERVRVYSHLQGNSSAELAEDARRMVEAGYTALRLYPFGAFGSGAGTSLEQLSFRGMAKHAAATLQAVRDAVGDEIDLMVDVINRLTPPEAIEVAKALEPYGLFFFEDPIEPENMDAWGHVAANMPVPVAMGERLYTTYQFRELLAHKGASYIRPDLSLAGGITNCKKIAALAEASYVGVAPHNPLSCVLTAACVQLDAAIHNVAIQEYPRDEYDAPKRDLVEMPLRREGGFLIVPQTPGIGIELNDEAFSHYPPEPYTRAPVIGPDGALRDY